MTVDRVFEKISGTEVSYWTVCKRRCWLARHKMFYNKGNYHIQVGRLVDSVEREGFTEIRVGRNKIDVTRSRDGIEVHEHKKADEVDDAAENQLLHYLYCLEEVGVVATGYLHAHGSKKVEEFELTVENRERLEEIYEGILSIEDEDIPIVEEKPVCHNGCSFEEFCYS